MGNLRDKYTNEEWSELEDQIEQEKRLGKPDTDFVSLAVNDLDLEELKNLRIILGDYFNSYYLSVLDNWIKYRENGRFK